MKVSLKMVVSMALGTALTAGNAFAVDKALEKCSVVKDGKGIIKAHKGDCKAGTHSCAGQNEAGEVDAFIVVPVGECMKINQMDFSGVDQKIKDKLEISDSK